MPQRMVIHARHPFYRPFSEILRYYVFTMGLFTTQNTGTNEQNASYKSRQKGDPMRRANLSPHTFFAQPVDQFLKRNPIGCDRKGDPRCL